MARTGNVESKSVKSNRYRKRLEAETISVILKRAKNGTAFIRWDNFFFETPNEAVKSLQRGGFGAFVIINRKVIPLPFNTPDGDIVITIGDWYTRDHKDLRTSLDVGKELGMPDGAFVNGKGPFKYNFSLPDGIEHETINDIIMSQILLLILTWILLPGFIAGSHNIDVLD